MSIVWSYQPYPTGSENVVSTTTSEDKTPDLAPTVDVEAVVAIFPAVDCKITVQPLVPSSKSGF